MFEDSVIWTAGLRIIIENMYTFMYQCACFRESLRDVPQY